MDGLLTLSAIFLGDALRRFNREFQLNQKFVQNKKTMCLHVYVMFGHTLILVATEFAFTYSVNHPQNLISDDLLCAARIVLITTEAFA